MTPSKASRTEAAGRSRRRAPRRTATPATARGHETDGSAIDKPDFLVAPKARGRPEPVSRFPEIINVSAELFRAQGYAETSIEDIARAVGILKGSLYHYIHTKEDLLYAIIDEIYARTDAKAHLVATFDGDVVDRLELFVDLHMQDAGDLAAKVAVFTTEYRSLPEDRRRQVQQRRDAYEELLVDTLKAGQREGVFVADLDARIAAIGILQMLNGTYQWYRPDGPRSMKEITKEFKKIIFRGLLARPGAASAGGRRK
ncbi:MAG TPA: TetR/AcrR family transcriptional regulator [Acidimicrobiales bacterium]|nr:TetR/AcrR family transcriptional regulator [Acidimicrobiales bacterium]